MFSTSTSAPVDEPHEHARARRALEVERERPLVAVEVLEVGARGDAGAPVRPTAARRAPRRRPSRRAGARTAGRRARDRQVEHPDVVERQVGHANTSSLCSPSAGSA